MKKSLQKKFLIGPLSALLFTLSVTCGLYGQTTIYVNSSTGNDATGNGSSGSPYKTFHKGYTMASAGNTIDLTGTFTWTDADETGDASSSGYTISKNITIQGQGAGNTFVQAATTANTADRSVLTIALGYNVMIRYLTIRNGKSYEGGGVLVYGTATMNACEVCNNVATSEGGGICVRGTLTIETSTIHDNTAFYQGGGIERSYYSGTGGAPSTSDLLTIINCTVTLNTTTATVAYNEGAGVYFRRGYGSITNSTITKNQNTGSVSSKTHGFGCEDNATGNLTFVNLKNNIIVDNYVTGYPNNGGDVGTRGSTNTCFADNGNNVFRKIYSTAYDGFSSYATTTWIDGIATNPDGTYVKQDGLGTTTGNINISSTLADNSTTKYTQTYALEANSLAINNGGTGYNECIQVPVADQRGFGRNGSVDIGAFEYEGNTPVTTNWTGGSNTTWNDVSNWSIRVPLSTDNVVIQNVSRKPVISDLPSSPAQCNNLTIQSGSSLTIDAGKALTVNGTLSNSGTLTINSDENGTGSVIHSTSGIPATVKTYITGSSNITLKKYHFVSIPVVYSNPTASLFLNSYIFELDPSQLYTTNNYGKWINIGNDPTTVLSQNKGYMIYYTSDNRTYSFAGTLKSDDYNCTVAGHSGADVYTFNLIPNPYPSSINWGYTCGWTKSAGVLGTCYIFNAGTGNYSSLVSTSDNYIPVGQAFMIVVNNEASPAITIKNTARAHSSQAFYKSGLLTENQLIVKAMSNYYSDETIISFSDYATTNFDNEIDGFKLFGLEEAPQLYTLASDVKYSINNLPVFADQKIVPMNFETQFTGEVTLTFSNIESFETSLNIYLQDLISNKTINLRNQSTYTFSHNPANQANRFNLVFGGTIGIGETAPQFAEMWISGNTLYINEPDLKSKPALLDIYNHAGQKLMSESLVLEELTTFTLSYKGFVIVKLACGKKMMAIKGIVN